MDKSSIQNARGERTSDKEVKGTEIKQAQRIRVVKMDFDQMKALMNANFFKDMQLACYNPSNGTIKILSDAWLNVSDVFYVWLIFIELNSYSSNSV